MVAAGALLAMCVAAACAPVAPLPVALPPPPRVPPVISGFGEWRATDGVRRWRHHGIDIKVPVGAPVLAAAPGTVLRVGAQKNAGQLVVLGHAHDLATVYWHLSAVDVRAGQVVRRGDPLGRAGMTGNATTPHLHFGVCRAPAGRCGNQLEGGWDDPGRHWAGDTPCFGAGGAALLDPVHLTYPVACADHRAVAPPAPGGGR